MAKLSEEEFKELAAADHRDKLIATLRSIADRKDPDIVKLLERNLAVLQKIAAKEPSLEPLIAELRRQTEQIAEKATAPRIKTIYFRRGEDNFITHADVEYL
jgi:hypothetical protein